MKLSKPQAKKVLGLSGNTVHDGQIRSEEFLRELKGRKAINKFREMRDNDSTVGSVMYAIEQVLRDVKYKVNPVDDSEEAEREAEFVRGVLSDMDHTLDDHISEALSYLTFGFSTFEVVYKRRVGPYEVDPSKKSKFTDGRMGVRKIASRAQWTIEKFEVDEKTGDVLGIRQTRSIVSRGPENIIPVWKLIHYKTTTTNGDPSGRSVLRNAYKSYTFLTNLQSIEAIAVERELHGIPIGRMPADYLSPDATDDQRALRSTFEAILRDLKSNEQAFALLPSDVHTDTEGRPTNMRIMDVELITSNGNRNIDIDPIIKRYQHDIARSVMAEFLMLGSSDRGSYALSKSKTDLFLKSLESYINTIYDVLNKQLIETLWALNGLDYDLMPKLVAGDVAQHDLRELGSYLRNLNGADISLADQTHIVDALLDNAELPNLDRDVYRNSRETAYQMDQARANYYLGPDDDVISQGGEEDE